MADVGKIKMASGEQQIMLMIIDHVTNTILMIIDHVTNTG